MTVEEDFEQYAQTAKKMYEHVAVCRQKHGRENLFKIPFDSREKLEDFLKRNDGDTHKIGFYARGFSNEEYIGENT